MHPGEVLREEFLIPFGLTAYRLADACRTPRTRIERIIREETGITTDTALRLARYFGTTPQFWTRLQERYELETKERALGAELKLIKPTAELEVA
jgi:addiction module HigA family antidote